MKFFGMSESSIIDFVHVSATSAKSPADLFSSLSALGLPATPEGESFASQLYNRVPRATPSSSKASNDGAGPGSKGKKEKRYGLLLDDVSGQEELAIKPEKRKKKKSKREDDVEEGSRKRRRSLSAEAMPPPAEDPDEPEDVRREKERLRDMAERDEFADRMKKKDKEFTKKVVEDRSSAKLNPEVAARRLLAEDEDARRAAMPSLRERSRQEYLAKRSQQQMELLRLEIQDEERYFRGVKMTKAEIRDLEYKKEVLRLAEERARIDDGYDGYVMPEDYITEKGKLDRKKKEAVLYQRCESHCGCLHRPAFSWQCHERSN